MKIRFNLLPTQQKKHLQTQKILRMIMEQEIYVSIVLGFFVACLFGMYLILGTEAIVTKDVEKQLMDHMGYKEVVDIHGQFKDVHKKMANINDIMQKHINWSRVFELISENVANDIVVDEIATVDNRLRIHAVAQSRDLVVDMKEKFRNIKIGDVQCFENISVPESDLAAPKNVTFTMSMDVNLACIQ